MTVFQKEPGVRVGAICDVYERNLEKALSTAAMTPGHRPKAYRNYKQLLEDKDIQAVLIATPEQGVELVEAEKRSKNIVHVGVSNFLECTRTRQTPTAPMALGFQSALVVQLANLSLRQGRRARWNAGARKLEM